MEEYNGRIHLHVDSFFSKQMIELLFIFLLYFFQHLKGLMCFVGKTTTPPDRFIIRFMLNKKKP